MLKEMPMTPAMPSSPTPVGSIFDALPGMGAKVAPKPQKTASGLGLKTLDKMIERFWLKGDDINELDAIAKIVAHMGKLKAMGIDVGDRVNFTSDTYGDRY